MGLKNKEGYECSAKEEKPESGLKLQGSGIGEWAIGKTYCTTSRSMKENMNASQSPHTDTHSLINMFCFMYLTV